MQPEFAATVRPALQRLLEPGEVLEGMIAVNRQKTFSGELGALAVTDRRLLLQPLDRHSRPKGEPLSLPPDAVESADVRGLGGEWWSTHIDVLDAGHTLKLRTTGGEKLKLMMMKGGSGVMGKLGGGEGQREGITALALAEWMRRRGAA